MNTRPAFRLIWRYITDTRLRLDFKILSASHEVYSYYAWKLLEDTNISKHLYTPISLDDIVTLMQIGDKEMLESTLDFLVGTNVLRFKNGKYVFSGRVPEFPYSKYNFVKKHYPGAAEWSHFLYERAKKTLIKGHVHDDTGFSDKRALELWDSILAGPLFSVRQLAIEELLSRLDDGMKVADLGCGSGIALAEILDKCNKKIDITAFDYSQEMIQRSQKRIKNFPENRLDTIHQHNAKNLIFVRHNLLEDFPSDDKFDAVFISLVINHISPEKRNVVFGKIKSIMKRNGTLVIFQLVNQSKFDRAFPDWLLRVVPSHKGFPFKKEYLRELSNNFSIIQSNLRSNIIVAKNVT